MARPKALGTESSAPILYAWAAFLAVIALGLVAFVAMASAAESNSAAKTDGKCLTEKMLRASDPINEVAPLIDSLTGRSAQQKIEEFNKNPPQSDYVGDQVLMWHTARMRILQGAILNKGCAVLICNVLGGGCVRFGTKRLPIAPKGDPA